MPCTIKVNVQVRTVTGVKVWLTLVTRDVVASGTGKASSKPQGQLGKINENNNYNTILNVPIYNWRRHACKRSFKVLSKTLWTQIKQPTPIIKLIYSTQTHIHKSLSFVHMSHTYLNAIS